MSAPMLTPKKVNCYIKQNHDIESLASFLGITATDLEEELKKIYSSKAYNDVTRKLKANCKKARKFKHEDAEPEEEVKVIQSTTTTKVSLEKPDKKVKTTPKPVPVKETLESVISKIDQTKKSITELEKQHQNFATIRSQAKAKLLKYKTDLEKLKKQVSEIEAKVDSSLQEYEEGGSQMKNITEQKKDLTKLLKELEAKKELLETVSIIVYIDGTIDVDNVALESDDSWKEIHQKIYGEDALDALTGTQTKALAKVFALIKSLDKKYEIVFETAEMQYAFDTLKGGII